MTILIALLLAQTTATKPAPKAAPAPATKAAPAPATKPADTLEPVKIRIDDRPQNRVMLAPKIGLFEPTTRLSGAVYFGAEAGYLTPLLDDHLATVAEVSFVRPKAAGAISDPRLVGGQDGQYSEGNAELAVLLSAIYRFTDAVPGFTPYLGAGPGLYFHRTTIDAFGSKQTEKEARWGFQMVGGGDYRLGPGAIFGEVRYHFSRVDFMSTGNANVGGFLALGVGYRLFL